MKKRCVIARKPSYFFILFALFLFLGSTLGGCEGSSYVSGSEDREARASSRHTITELLSPQSDGRSVAGNDFVSIDTSNITEGYFMVKYQGDADNCRIQVTVPDGTVYSYCLLPGDYETFPFSGGSGDYQIDVYEHAYDNKYALSFSHTACVQLTDEFQPFLYPNQYAWYTADSLAVSYGRTLSDRSCDDLDYVEKVFQYVTETITYDTELAEALPTDYIPDIDATLERGTGICFDYASLMCAFLRSQQIPAKLVVGYSGTTYHAWISVYLEESGWVDNMIEFDGSNWSLMDPTLAANNSKDSVRDYIGDGSHYIVKYSY